MVASEDGHTDVVNRLLECKQIDVNLQEEVGENVTPIICFNGISEYLLKIVLYDVCMHVLIGWMDSSDGGDTKCAFRCGQSVVAVRTN